MPDCSDEDQGDVDDSDIDSSHRIQSTQSSSS